MARFVAGPRFGRLLAIGGLVAVGWLLGIVSALFGAAPAAADAHVRTDHVATAETVAGAEAVGHTSQIHRASPVGQIDRIGRVGRVADVVDTEAARTGAGRHATSTAPHVAAGSALAGGFPTVSDSALADAGAMAGRTVDGLTSQSKPALPEPSTADHSAGANGFVPRGGGSGPSGPGLGDVARSVPDPRLMVAPALLARVPAPVVRTAADDPSFSPD
ncbi:hypothetical protein [Sphaerisporangium corydalis]|uniref:Uncharacterized protein n=1 Tax=Sphaerisporangium corydalis TaxID=1441875 RepID=A0ABV9EPB3_9ACTN|nr:hypothetical protein [Sphaerisporangium corydalis]